MFYSKPAPKWPFLFKVVEGLEVNHMLSWWQLSSSSFRQSSRCKIWNKAWLTRGLVKFLSFLQEWIFILILQDTNNFYIIIFSSFDIVQTALIEHTEKTHPSPIYCLTSQHDIIKFLKSGHFFFLLCRLLLNYDGESKQRKILCWTFFMVKLFKHL